ncbi:Xylogalacturonan beta-1,3-xylosyltransferase protein [Dioscorea alata]|uniref:Xylogalacturonan beta-1,3-xylosyltransferase protein n=1 Tax=Dioscorea alata TaxID=55571 RepID=A0ACB7WKS4_DIOAL|nr:Xylogalacturonan beta-1,3-xylosyltransferase protein [Dioscorea alata]
MMMASQWITTPLFLFLFLLFPTLLLLLFTSSVHRPVILTSSSNHLDGKFRLNGLVPVTAGDAEASRALTVSSPPAPLIERKTRSFVERDLARARVAIQRAVLVSQKGNVSQMGNSSVLSSPATGDDHLRVYRNPAAFFRSYKEMKKRFRVYVYQEGDAPLVHDGPCKNIYTTEGRFIQELEMTGISKSSLRTSDPNRAHAFFLPFSVAMMVKYLYIPNSRDQSPIRRFVSDYVGVVGSAHPFWNRTAGADHFMLSCHDWGPYVSNANKDLYTNSIRALCNANTSEGFNPTKDVSIPEVHLLTGDIPIQLRSPPPPHTPRPFLAFFAGGLHGPIRPPLLHQWQNRDPSIQVYEYLPKNSTYDYFSFMLKSKFCLCPSGWEVASPRVVEAIYTECIPVIISEGYVLPFSDVLKWEEFSLTVRVEELPELKELLGRKTEEEMDRLRRGLRAVRKHFVFNQPAKSFDVFHMILHSVWLRRLNVKLD